jgi:hypothetical protein
LRHSLNGRELFGDGLRAMMIAASNSTEALDVG